jgi:hypothetical protein
LVDRAGRQISTFAMIFSISRKIFLEQFPVMKNAVDTQFGRYGAVAFAHSSRHTLAMVAMFKTRLLTGGKVRYRFA